MWRASASVSRLTEKTPVLNGVFSVHALFHRSFPRDNTPLSMFGSPADVLPLETNALVNTHYQGAAQRCPTDDAHAIDVFSLSGALLSEGWPSFRFGGMHHGINFAS